ncbi:hypothetical protein AKJ09_08708 [Labilithrix luteola]|uniref:Uncharacterized protein n=1 Tax=Labilithrix luteola TaxID=1391654 RepID=A0A0K1Q9E6_9BACT|nr:hypothetical protein AKJ09_08708 [Labilithrix luteola]
MHHAAVSAPIARLPGGPKLRGGAERGTPRAWWDSPHISWEPSRCHGLHRRSVRPKPPSSRRSRPRLVPGWRMM